MKSFDYDNLYFPEGKLDLKVLRGVAGDPRFGFLRLAPDDVLETLELFCRSACYPSDIKVKDAIQSEIKRREEGAG
jgi:hypothetical protein